MKTTTTSGNLQLPRCSRYTSLLLPTSISTSTSTTIHHRSSLIPHWSSIVHSHPSLSPFPSYSCSCSCSHSYAELETQLSMSSSSSLPSLEPLPLSSLSSSSSLPLPLSSLGTAAASAVLSPSVWSSPLVVGSAWMVSSALLTTYSTTKFLKFKHSTPSSSSSTLLPPPPSSSSSTAVTSSSSSSLSKRRPFDLSRVFPLDRPARLTLLRFSGSLLLGLVFPLTLGSSSSVGGSSGMGSGMSRSATFVREWAHVWRHRWRETREVCPSFAWPAGLLFLANYCNAIALDRIGISLTYTSKCGIPLLTVLLQWWVQGASTLPSATALGSLVPVAVGIAAASWNAPSYDKMGMAAAAASCVAQAGLNLSSKRVLGSYAHLSGAAAQRATVAVALPLALLFHATLVRPSPDAGPPPAPLTVLAVAAYHCEYVLSFSFVRLVEPVTYGTCDALRRLSIIVAGRRMFGGPAFSKLNLGGMALAVLGAMAYSIAVGMGSS